MTSLENESSKSYSQLERECDRLYNKFAGLPKTSDKYHVWFGGHKTDSFYKVLIDETYDRKKTWSNLLSNHLSFSWLDFSKDSDFRIKEWNNFFHSGWEIIDETNHRKVTAYTPWYSRFFRYFLGGDLIITKIKEN